MRDTLLIALACLLLPAAASAQDAPRFGIVMGFPAQVGALWNVSGRLALRPQIDWTRGATESTTTTTGIVSFPVTGPIVTATTTTTTSSSNWNIGTGVSALIYLTPHDALRTYVAPGFTYSRSTSTTQSTTTRTDVDILPLPPTTAVSPTTTHGSNYTTTALFGAQYTLGTRFGVFGELGLAYVHSGDVPTFSVGSIIQRDASNWSVGVRSGVGVILFF